MGLESQLTFVAVMVGGAVLFLCMLASERMWDYERTTRAFVVSFRWLMFGLLVAAFTEAARSGNRALAVGAGLVLLGFMGILEGWLLGYDPEYQDSSS